MSEVTIDAFLNSTEQYNVLLFFLILKLMCFYTQGGISEEKVPVRVGGVGESSHRHGAGTALHPGSIQSISKCLSPSCHSRFFSVNSLIGSVIAYPTTSPNYSLLISTNMT
jgi:hypothetical protein